MVDGYLNMRRM